MNTFVSGRQLIGNTNSCSLDELKKTTTRLAFFNFFLVAVLGVVLRAYPLFPITFPSYKNLLHAHSHFAFGGWVMPVLFVLILKYFPEMANRIAYCHLRNIAALLLMSAYGMLISFPFQGYAAISIGFSTLSIFAGFYMAITFWNVLAKVTNKTSVLFLKAGLAFLVLSSIGPFSTGPLIAMGKTGTPLYYNAIYFYLHFQYNGWFTFAILAILYKMMEKRNRDLNGRIAYYLFTISCVPAYFLSTLWSHPPLIFYILAAIAAIVQVIAVYLLAKDLVRLPWRKDFIDGLIKTAIFFFVLKNIMQLVSAIPAIANLAYMYRNFIIAYLHMVLLGFVSAFALAAILEGNRLYVSRLMKQGTIFFIVSFLSTEILLVLNAMGVHLELEGLFYPQLLLLFSLFFPVGIFFIWYCSRELYNFQVKG